MKKHSARIILCISSLLLFISGNTFAAVKDYEMPFGKSGKIVYDGNAKTVTITVNNKIVISDAGLAVKVNGKTYNGNDFPAASVKKEKLNDALGKGTKYTYIYKGDGFELEQYFYTYNNLPYFVTQLVIKGTSIATNYMAPITGGKINFAKAEQLQSVFIPYDNDAFIKYDSKALASVKSMMSAEAGLVFNNTTREGFIAGSLEHTNWKSGAKVTNDNNTAGISLWAGYTEKEVTRDEIPHGIIKGNSVLSPKMFVGYFSDWRDGMEFYGKANRIVEKPFVANWDKPTPVGWNSWGVLQEKINYENTTAVADFFADSIPQFRVGNTAFIDLDSFWDNMVKGGFTGDFSKVKQFADYCKSKGLQPGAYWAPFTDWGHKDGPNRKAEGGNYTFGEMWTKTANGYFDFDGARAIDPTHPGTLQRVDYVINKLKQCGFKMIKIDFLGHAAAESTSFYDKNITTGMQAYRVGMEHLVKALDGQMLIYAAISPSLATSRYTHMRRIACDAWKTIDDTQYTLNSVNYGWWQTYTYNYIDADHVVFANESEGENRARLLSAIVTGPLITGDDYSKHGPWSERAKELLQNKQLLKIVENGVAFRPVEGDTGTKATEVFTRKIGKDWYVAVFDYGNEAKDINLPFERLDISGGKSYQATELFTNKNEVLKNSLQIALPAQDARIFKITAQ
jgi:alpha-galactosidase